MDMTKFTAEIVQVLKPQEQVVTMEACSDDIANSVTVNPEVKSPNSHEHVTAECPKDAHHMKPEVNTLEILEHNEDKQESCKQPQGGESETVCIPTTVIDLSPSCLQTSQEDTEGPEKIHTEESDKSQHVINLDQLCQEGINIDGSSTTFANEKLPQPCQDDSEGKEPQEMSPSEEEQIRREYIEEISSTVTMNPTINVPQEPIQGNIDMQGSPKQPLEKQDAEMDVCTEDLMKSVNDTPQPSEDTDEMQESYLQVEGEECTEEHAPTNMVGNPDLLLPGPEAVEDQELHNLVEEGEQKEPVVCTDVSMNPTEVQEDLSIQESDIEVQKSHDHELGEICIQEVVCIAESINPPNTQEDIELVQSQKPVEVQISHDNSLEDVNNQVVCAGEELQDHVEVQQSPDDILEIVSNDETSCIIEISSGPAEAQEVKELHESSENLPVEESDQEDISAVNMAAVVLGACQEKTVSREQIQQPECIEELNNSTAICNPAVNVPQERPELLDSHPEVVQVQDSDDQVLGDERTEEAFCSDVSVNSPRAQEDVVVQESYGGVHTKECDKQHAYTDAIVNPVTEPAAERVEKSLEHNGEVICVNDIMTQDFTDILQTDPEVMVVEELHEECTEENVCIEMSLNAAEVQGEIQESHKAVLRNECDEEVDCSSDIVNPSTELPELQTEVVVVQEPQDKVLETQCSSLQTFNSNESAATAGDVSQPRPEVVEVYESHEQLFSSVIVSQENVFQQPCEEIVGLRQYDNHISGQKHTVEDAATSSIANPSEALQSAYPEILQVLSNKQNVTAVCTEQDPCIVEHPVEDTHTDSQWQKDSCQHVDSPCTVTTHLDMVPMKATTHDVCDAHGAAPQTDSSHHVVEISPMSASQLDTATRMMSLPGINSAADLSLEIPPSDGEVVPDSQLDDSQGSPIIPITYTSPSQANEPQLPSTTASAEPEQPVTYAPVEQMFDDSDQSQAPAVEVPSVDDSDEGSVVFPASQRSIPERAKKRLVQTTETESDDDFEPSQMSFRSPMKKHKLKRLSQKRPAPKARRSKRPVPDSGDDEDTGDTMPPSTQPSRVASLLNHLRAKRQCTRTTTDSESDAPFVREEPVAAIPDKINPRLQHRRSKIDSADEHVTRAASIINEAQGILESNYKLSSNQRVNAWQDELRKLKETARLPETVIAVVGDTGSGKSSIMNALIGHASVLPTSGMRACTAVVVEVKDNPGSNYYEGEIEFLSKEEWNKELETLLKELQGADGRVRACQPDPNSDLIVAWNKVRAVYGSFPDGVTLQTLPRMKKVTSYLGRTKEVRESRPGTFRREVDSYIESTTGRDGGQFWPIVKRVSLRIPNCSVCSSGATLVDLPGIRDSNAARDKIAKEFLQRCTAVWVVASIHRAVDDKTAKELLGEHFRRQLLMDGQYGSVSFVCTKTDIHSPSELMGSLNVRHKVAPHEEAIEDLTREDEALKDDMKWRKEDTMQLNAKLSSLRKERNGARSDIVEVQKLLDGDSQEGEEEELLAERENLEELATEKNAEMEVLKEKVKVHFREMEANKIKIHDLEKKIGSQRKSISSICVLARNEFAKVEIRRDFKAGLCEMKRRAGMTDDMSDEEDEFETEGEDDEDILCTTDNLKVFCVSSTEFLKLKGLLPSNDGPAQVFQTVEETGVPALEQHVHVMTGVRRQQGTRQLICSVHQCVQNVESYLMDEGTKITKIRVDAKGVIKDQIKRFKKTGLATVHSETMEQIYNIFTSSLKKKIDEGKQTAIEQAEATVAKWGSKQSKENKKEGGLHFSTYKAAVRRSGVFKSPAAGNIDFNEDLTDPVYTAISIVWDRVFNMTLAVHLENFKKDVVEQVHIFVRELHDTLQSIGVAVDRLQRTEQHLKQRVDHTVSVAVTEIKAFIADRQREINRVVTPRVQMQMEPAYQRCNAESGTGTFNRMKGHMQQHVGHKKEDIFYDGSSQLKELLHELQEQIKGMLLAIIERVVADCESVLEPYWEEPRNTKAFRQAFLQGIQGCLAKTTKLALDAGVTLPVVVEPRSPTPSPPVTWEHASSAMGSASGGVGTLPCSCFTVVPSGSAQRWLNMFGECEIHLKTPASEQEQSDDGAGKADKVKHEKTKMTYGEQKPTGSSDIRHALGSGKQQSKENIPRAGGQRAPPAPPANTSGRKRSLLSTSQPQHINVQTSNQRLSLPKTPPTKVVTGVRVKEEPGAPAPKKQRPIDHGVIDLTMSSDDDDDYLPPMASVLRSSQRY